jgi:hypothetical protein
LMKSVMHLPVIIRIPAIYLNRSGAILIPGSL